MMAPAARNRAIAGASRAAGGASADVIRFAELRFVMSGVMLFASHPTPHHVSATLDGALRWSHEQLALHRATGT